ncbi:SDR family NAD(P)-dependent oxidoreductase [Sneathiella sp. HT1-7]|uniref:SDR family NAD(P)-dependent oxidoreductase n=1 Tax=Sneathiella sp. HT1-7 TaxID=2887192 RepID=UPI001D158397|nr:SDR family oxidoreductase [Sneathiella sp. HT1-7]MCC3304343.1 SDR family oxidoreductase [Sneathiella sp. HT1-7]
MKKTAVVTGAASGIGRRSVERLLNAGWTVWALDLSHEKLAAFETPDCTGRYYHRACDVSSASEIKEVFEAVSRENQSIDALICSAGVTLVGSLMDFPEEATDKLIDVNLKGPWLTIRGAYPLLKYNSNMADPARIVIVGSVSGIRPKVGSGMYSATKAALHTLTGVLAVELAKDGITVNAVAPGTTDTPMAQQAAENAGSSGFQLSGTSPLGRIADTDDIVDAIEFFLGSSAKYVNGTVLPVDGGTRAAYSRG